MSRTKTTIIAVFVLAVTFVAGAAVGFTADRFLHRGPRRPPEFVSRALVYRLDRQLDLNDAQRKQVEEILERHHKRINSLFGAVHPKVREEIEQANREISAVLTPEQRAKFEEMKMRFHGPRGPRRGDRERREPTR